jgi:aspartyl/asparaginyl-tRNA synthetase
MIFSKREISDKKFENPVTWGIDLASEHERWICEEGEGSLFV